MTRLEDANTSQEIELSRYFRKKTDKKDILVLVEGDDDIPFWTLLFQDYIDKYAHIDIQTLKLTDEESRKERDRKGKNALMEITHLGPSKVVAVDMDYDNIVPDYHSYSARIGTDKYVLHTIYYSIENHKLFPDIIHRYAEMVVKEPVDYNFEELHTLLSKAISPILLLLIAYEIKRVIPNSKEQTSNEICIDDLFHLIASWNFRLENITEDIERWSVSLQVQYRTLIERYSTEISTLKQTLQESGIDESKYWKYLQGHTLSNFLLRALVLVARENIRNHETALRNDATITDKEAAILSYHQSLGFITQKLSDEVEYYFNRQPLVSSTDEAIEEIKRQIEAVYQTEI